MTVLITTYNKDKQLLKQTDLGLGEHGLIERCCLQVCIGTQITFNIMALTWKKSYIAQSVN